MSSKLPNDYFEHVYAGVLGKIIGVYLGRPFEGWWYDDIMQKLGEITGYVHDRLDQPLIVTDDDINARDWKDVMWAISTRMDPVRDLTLVERTPIDYLDFASPESGLGGKIGLDATNKVAPETHREWGEKIAMDQNVIDRVNARWQELGLPGSGKPIWK